jgi:hypothetical protein
MYRPMDWWDGGDLMGMQMMKVGMGIILLIVARNLPPIGLELIILSVELRGQFIPNTPKSSTKIGVFHRISTQTGVEDPESTII